MNGNRWRIGLVLSALLAAPTIARADDGPGYRPLFWDPAWTHAGPADYVLTGVALGGLALEVGFLQPIEPPLRWTGPILFDQAVRNALRGSTPAIRETATNASWAILALDVAYPLFVDVPYAWARYGPGVARDLFWQDTTALALATAVDMGLRDVVGRARPQNSDCLAAGGSTSQCIGGNTEATRSFPGGHFAVATTSAVLVCTQHLSMHLYGAPWDAVACAAALSVDAAVGTLRIVTDNHWTTDIVAGGLLGVAFGWGVPVVMHLHGHASASDHGATLLPVPVPVNRGAGLGVAGVF